jgi:hypothetical protein
MIPFSVLNPLFLFRRRILLASLAAAAIGLTAHAAEESLDLDAVTEAPKAPPATSASRFSLMGRVDITTETSAPEEIKPLLEGPFKGYSAYLLDNQGKSHRLPR